MTQPILAVAGNPVLHSRSPELFNHALNHHQIPAIYTRLLIQQVDELFTLWNGIGLTGLNITTPLKEAVIPYLDELDPIATKIRSVNLILRENHHLIGYNTDYYGALNAIRSHQPVHSSMKGLVMGAGPAGRAAALALTEQGLNVFLVNRSFDKAVTASLAIGCQPVPLSGLAAVTSQADIIISALSPGIQLIQPQWIKPGCILLDANYKQPGFQSLHLTPPQQIIPGLDWLIHQAVPSFQYFTGQATTPKILQHGLDIPGLKPRSHRIALIGFMGSGKTTIARRLANLLGYNFLDLDHLIEQRLGQSIPQIFQTQGESEFRRQESAILQDVIHQEQIVLATGGGIVIDPVNRNCLNRYAVTCWLWVPLHICMQRAQTQPCRPMLQNKSDEQIQHLYDNRSEYYAQASDLIVSYLPNVEQTARNLYAEIHQTFNH